MKTIRKISENLLFITSMVTLVMFISCTKAPLVNEEIELADEIERATRNAQHNATGEDWFSSIYFANGILTSSIPSLNGYSPADQNLSDNELLEVQQYQNNILNHIRSVNPNFFTTFKAKMESQDPYIIEQQIVVGKDALFDAFEVLLAQQGYNLDQEMANYMQYILDGDGPNQGVAMVVVVTVVLIIAIVITLTVDSGDGNPDDYASINPQGFGGMSLQVLAAEISML